MIESERIAKAVGIAVEYGLDDGADHKMWVIDRMVRILTDCPIVIKTAVGSDGNSYTYETYEQNETYRAAVGEYWDEGIAP